MLFLFLIGVCLSMNQDSLQPISSNIPTGLISIAKTNPFALVEMLDDADPDAINAIVKILRTLIADGEKEAKGLIGDIRSRTQKRDAALKELQRLRAIEGTLYSRLRYLAGLEARAKGVYDAVLADFAEAKPGLTNEISILKTVLGMLNDLLQQNQPDEKALLELGSSDKGKAYLKLLANVQADPEKLKKIIGFVGTLLDRANSELSTLRGKVALRLKQWKKATKDRVAAQALWSRAKQARVECEEALAEAEGALEAAKKAWEVRKPVLTREDKTLKEVIRLLLSTADGPQPTVGPRPVRD